MKFLSTLLLIVAIYYLLKLLLRIFAPYLIKKFLDKMQQKAERQFTNINEDNNVKTGETVIDKKPKTTKGTNENVGEYVDFEEIE